ncbi:unnamed protein product [Paramecium pentaurelia]|uniref:Uncharacterized protein n=1 Tax=Paramecium pentaurelia TaxID=43138 RepID=A0A8S1SKJ4_9CILI|nr:unnamed protein product [Paramecium pentaurelia]
MKVNINEGEKMYGVENLMIELDNFNECLEQENKEDIDRNNKKKLKKHKKLKDKLKNKHKNLDLINSGKLQRKEKRNIIVIDEYDDLQKIKDLKLKDIDQTLQKKSVNTIKNKDKIQNISKSVQNYKQEQKCNNSFQENLRIKQKTNYQNLKKEVEIQTDDKCDIKKLEIFHLLKISQNFILSTHSLTEKIIKMYV